MNAQCTMMPLCKTSDLIAIGKVVFVERIRYARESIMWIMDILKQGSNLEVQ